MTPAGARGRKILFRVASITTDQGVETESFGDGPQAWARVTFGSGAERREAAAAGSVQAATFRVLSNAAVRAVTRRGRIVFDGDEWGITAIAPVGPQGAEIEFTATVRMG